MSDQYIYIYIIYTTKEKKYFKKINEYIFHRHVRSALFSHAMRFCVTLASTQQRERKRGFCSAVRAEPGVLLSAVSFFTVLPCGMAIKQHCTGLSLQTEPPLTSSRLRIHPASPVEPLNLPSVAASSFFRCGQTLAPP